MHERKLCSHRRRLRSKMLLAAKHLGPSFSLLQDAQHTATFLSVHAVRPRESSASYDVDCRWLYMYHLEIKLYGTLR